MALAQQFLALDKEAQASDNQILSAYLSTQAAAFRALIGGGNGTDAPSAPIAVESPRPDTAGAFPLLGEILAHTPGEELRTLLTLDLSEHLFLSHHALLPVPDSLKPVEGRLPTLPLTFQVEIVAEAAQTLVPELTVIACEEMRASTWTSLLDVRTLEIEISARRTSATTVDVEFAGGGQAGADFPWNRRPGARIP